MGLGAISVLFFFVLAVLAVNFYKGKFWHCTEEGAFTAAECSKLGGEQKPDNVNFDNIEFEIRRIKNQYSVY